MKPHRGINVSSIAGEGLQGLPGLLITIAFVFIAIGAFIPPRWDFLVAVFILAEVAATALYLRGARHDERETADLERVWHSLNEIDGGDVKTEPPAPSDAAGNCLQAP